MNTCTSPLKHKRLTVGDSSDTCRQNTSTICSNKEPTGPLQYQIVFVRQKHVSDSNKITWWLKKDKMNEKLNTQKLIYETSLEYKFC